jgi:hypothetical protein
MLPVLDLTLGGPAVAVAAFRLADDSGPPQQATTARVQATTKALTVSFACADTDAWGTLRGRDAPVYKEECVEVFIAPGAETPRDYFEFELSPLGTFFDAKIHNPTGRRESMSADLAWDAAGASWKASIDQANARWTAEMRLPWAALGFPDPARLPRHWRLNLYRIDRPRDGSPPEYSCWSPTLATPPNFHLPARFGSLRLR